MVLISLILSLLLGVIQESKGRSLSLSVNLSLVLNDEKLRNNSTLSAEVLRSCMKETEISMAELKLFRYSLPSDEPDTVDGMSDNNDGQEVKNTDYDDSAKIIEDRNEQSLQCFAHCLYEKLGLIKDGVFMEPDFFRKFHRVLEKEKQPVRECTNLESMNNCEAAYKLHICYSKLNSLEAELRIREILDYNDTMNHDVYINNPSNEMIKELPDFDVVDPAENEVDKDESKYLDFS